ncbi:hypothetical protein ATER59S_02395 [Aquamicrobium terrae]
MPDLSTLIERVEALTGPSRDADYRIEKAIVRPGEFPASEIWPPFMVGSKFDRSIPAYTASIDAAVALVERVLPGWFWFKPERNKLGVYRLGEKYTGNHINLAIALVLATLRALHAQEAQQ